MDLISSLKPNKINIIGTIVLLAANWIGGFTSRILEPLMIARPQIMRTENFTNIGGFGGGFTNYQIPSLLNYLILAVLFYIILSILISLKQEK